MDEPILAAVALTLATKAAEGVAEAGRAAFAALAQLVRRRFEGQSSATVALAEAEAQSTDRDRVQALQDQLELAVAQDPEFRLQLGILWRELEPHLIANADGVVNNVSGSVAGNVVQARDIRGGVLLPAAYGLPSGCLLSGTCRGLVPIT